MWEILEMNLHAKNTLPGLDLEFFGITKYNLHGWFSNFGNWTIK